jgi:heterodisulfide reductase subunit B2
MRIGYYPGCSLLGSSREFDESTRAVLRALDVELVEVPEWSCCGASSAHILNHNLSMALPARVLALAEQAGLTEVLAPCAACLNRLLSAQREFEEHPNKRAEVAEFIGLPFKGTVKIVNILEVLDRLKDRISAKVSQPFALNVANYYGCLLVRPPRVMNFDRPEDPQSMDRMMDLIGAESIPWPFKTECCGASFSITRTDIVAKLAGKLVAGAVNRGADVIVVACPMCHSNLDLRRPEINENLQKEHRIPVMFVTQAIGLALGLEPRKLGLLRHMVPVKFKEPAHAGASQV